MSLDDLTPVLIAEDQRSLFAAKPQIRKRTLEFFATQIHNDHTRKAYATAVKTFSAWCEGNGIAELRQVEPIHIAAYIKSRNSASTGLPRP